MRPNTSIISIALRSRIPSQLPFIVEVFEEVDEICQIFYSLEKWWLWPKESSNSHRVREELAWKESKFDFHVTHEMNKHIIWYI